MIEAKFLLFFFGGGVVPQIMISFLHGSLDVCPGFHTNSGPQARARHALALGEKRLAGPLPALAQLRSEAQAGPPGSEGQWSG